MKKWKTWLGAALLFLCLAGVPGMILLRYAQDPPEIVMCSGFSRSSTTDAYTAPEELYERADMVLLGTFRGKAEGGRLLPGWEGSPTEYGFLSVERAFKGSCGDTVKFYYLGGEMYLREMFRTAQREGLDWREWDPFYYYKDKSLDDPEMNVIYRCEEGDFYVKPQVGERYLVFLWYVPDLYKDYAVLGDNYGFLHVNDEGKVYNPDTKSYDTLPMLEELSALEE